MKFYFKLLTSIFIFLIININLFAWGKIGHRIVGEIAQKRINKETKSKIKKIIGNLTLAQVSNWMDEIKSDSSWEHAKAWHYVNIADNSSYQKETKNKDGDILQALYFFQSILRNDKESLERKAVALKCLIHLMGDLHQPLHIGRYEDRGGGKIELKWFGHKKNLHEIWDESLIDYEQLSYTEFSDLLEKEMSTLNSWSNGDFISWAEESYVLRKDVYSVENEKLGYDYYFKNKKLLHEQLYKAGIRLGLILNDIFSNKKNNILVRPSFIPELPFKVGKTL